MKIEFDLRTKSALNLREHWAAKARRVKAERTVTAYEWRSELQRRLRAGEHALAHLPLVVLLTRIAEHAMDDDNLRGALKGVRDQVAAELGVDDGDPRVRYEYAQEQAKRGVWRVRVELRPAGPK